MLVVDVSLVSTLPKVVLWVVLNSRSRLPSALLSSNEGHLVEDVILEVLISLASGVPLADGSGVGLEPSRPSF